MITPSFGLTATERVLPKLALDFTTASLDSRVTFTRIGNTATVVNASGVVQSVVADTPRFDFDPTTLICKGLLIEESRTNLFTYSGDFTNIVWVATQGTIAAATVTNPDATTSGALYTEDTATSLHAAGRTFVFTSGTSYSYSVWVKSNGRSVIEVGAGATGTWAARVRFNLALGTILASTGTGTITPFPNGWYLCTVSGAAGATASTSVNVRGYSLTAASATYTGDGVSGFYLFGGDFQVGAFPTSYIPTVASQVTRTADTAVMTGTNFNSWYNASEGAFVASTVLSRQSNTGATAIFSANDNTSANLINCFYRASGALGSNIFAATFSQLDQTQLGTTAANVVVNTGIAYKLNDAVSYANGTVQTTDTSVTVPTINQLQLGFTPVGAYLNGIVRNLKFYKQRILNAEGQAFSK